MDRAATQIETLQALELRVNAGPQRGARAPLETGRPVILATGEDGTADIVLAGTEGCSVRLVADLPAGSVEVLRGSARLGDRELAAGQTADWAACTPLAIGGSVVAFGLACVDGWTTPDTAAARPAAAAKPATRPAGKAAEAAFAAASRKAAAPAKARKSLFKRADFLLAATGATVLMFCAGAMGVAHYSANAAAPVAATVVAADPVAQLADMLRAGEFADLQLVTRASGVALRGRLATLEQRGRLDQLLAASSVKPAVEVFVDESVAREVSEVFRINGIDAHTQVTARGRIVAQVTERDTNGLARAEDAVRRDVRGIESLEVKNDAKALPPPPPPVSSDPGKRIASLVPGATGYLVTADGSRYFVGAMLPTGHRIVKIGTGTVGLELNGQQSSLSF